MRELCELAQGLLADGKVKAVIGYEEGPTGVRPAFVTSPAQADKLIFDTRCVHNLASYLNPRRQHLTQLGKPVAVVVKGCDARAVAGLIRECQVKREEIVIIGVRCGGVVCDPSMAAELTPETVSDRCMECDVREPKFFDYVVGELPQAPPKTTKRDDKLAELESMTLALRWAFWSEQLSRCIRCNACREVCPMCFCVECKAEKSQPQWVESAATTRGNLIWQMMRAMHQTGRCVGCLECERACPADIPIGLLGRHIAQTVERRFAFKPGEDTEASTPMEMFRTDDDQEFFL